MGGIGSGRHFQFGADTTERFCSLDVRWLKREGILSHGNRRRITWSRRGEVTDSINIQSEPGRLILDYCQRNQVGEWQAKRYPVYLDTTSCHMGGERHWFLCPALGCGRRVAILYGGAIYACRHCYRLAYPSQRETPGDRASRRATRIREKLDWPGGILNGDNWGKPKGMHWRTYERLCREHGSLSDRALVGLMDYLDRLTGRL